MQEQQNRCYSVAVIMTRCAYTHKFVFGLFWCTKVRVARNCSAFFIAIFQRGFNLVHHRVTRTARARRRSGGQKRPSGAFLRRGRFPYGSHRLFQRIESARPAPKNTPEPITQGRFAVISPVPMLFAGRVSLTRPHRRFRWCGRQYPL